MNRRTSLARTGILLIAILGLGASLSFLTRQMKYHQHDMEDPGPKARVEVLPPVTLAKRSYPVLSVNGRAWLAENLRVVTETGSTCYERDPEHCRTHGRLYNWAAARRACASIGWRLPTRAEWETLLRAQRNYRKAYEVLTRGGAAGFNARLGGSFQPPTGTFANLGEVGGYWSSTENVQDGTEAWKVRFRRETRLVEYDYFPKDWYFSCRCVKDP